MFKKPDGADRIFGLLMDLYVDRELWDVENVKVLTLSRSLTKGNIERVAPERWWNMMLYHQISPWRDEDVSFPNPVKAEKQWERNVWDVNNPSRQCMDLLVVLWKRSCLSSNLWCFCPALLCKPLFLFFPCFPLLFSAFSSGLAQW